MSRYAFRTLARGEIARGEVDREVMDSALEVCHGDQKAANELYVVTRVQHMCVDAGIDPRAITSLSDFGHYLGDSIKEIATSVGVVLLLPLVLLEAAAKGIWRLFSRKQ